MSIIIEKDDLNQIILTVQDRLGVNQARKAISVFERQQLMLDLYKTLSGIQRRRIIARQYLLDAKGQ